MPGSGDLGAIFFAVRSQDNYEYIIAESSNIGNDSPNNRNRWLCCTCDNDAK